MIIPEPWLVSKELCIEIKKPLLGMGKQMVKTSGHHVFFLLINNLLIYLTF